MNLSLLQKGLLIAVVPLALDLVFLSALSFLQAQSDRLLEKEARSASIAAQLTELQQLIYLLGATSAMYTVTRQPALVARVERIATRIKASESALEANLI